ncbi:hypothetical protein Q0N28_14235, partial [Staphylococcus aureus]|nr:hypothetical protein [Staphylococcus aureus]
TSSKLNNFSKYDQNFFSVKFGKKTATSVQIKVSNVTVKQLKSVYGNDLVEQADVHGHKNPNSDDYKLVSGQNGNYHTPVTFVQKNGKVQSAIIGF